MADAPRRPILKLKSPPPRPTTWKCKPCGAKLEITGSEPADADIRCAACGARLGKGADFHAGGDASRVRARRVGGPA